MSRRNQSRRRRAYGRRQHEVRERRPERSAAADWTTDFEADTRDGWLPEGEEHATLGEGYGGYAR